MKKKKRSRAGSRRSPEAVPPEPQSGLPSPSRSAESASSDRSGEGASSSSDREGKQRTQASPHPGEETDVSFPSSPPDALQWRRQPASSDRSGEGPSAAAAAAAHRDWVPAAAAAAHRDWVQGNPNQVGGCSPKQRRKKKKKKKRHLPGPMPMGPAPEDDAVVGEDDAVVREDDAVVGEAVGHLGQQRWQDKDLTILPSSDRCVNLQKAGEAASDPPAGKKKGKHDGPRAVQMRSSPSHLLSPGETPPHTVLSSKPPYLAAALCQAPIDSLVAEESAMVSEEEEEQQQQHDKASSQSLEISQAGHPCTNLEEAGEASSAPPTEEGSFQHTLLLEEEHIKQKVCFDDANLVMQKSGMPPSHRSSLSGEAQEETLIGGEEASSPLSMEKEPKPTSSVDHGKVAQDEDEEGYSDKKPPYVALSEIITHDDDRQNSNKIGVQAIEDYKQEQERIWNVQDLLELEEDDISKMFLQCSRQLTYVPPEVHPDYMTAYEPQELVKLNERLALYRIRSYELSVDSKLDKLDDTSLMQHYPPPVLCDEGYFRYYEESLEWYIDDELCKYAGFEDYQLIVLRNDNYHEWDLYCSIRNTYEEDHAYVQYCEAMENETKWIEDYLQDSILPWERVECVAYIQALKIAAGFPKVSRSLVYSGFKEHIWSLDFDFSYKGLDAVYFEIWKRVAKQKMNFREALLEVYHGNFFSSGRREIEIELDESTRWPFSMEDKYNAHVACIADLVSDDAARPLITEAIKRMYPKPKSYVDYARKKLDIAEEIGLTTKGRRSQSTPPCRGGNGEAKLELDS